MNRIKGLAPQHAMPDWFLKTLRVMGDAGRGIRNIDIELRHAMRMDGIDSRLMSEMQYVRDALGAVEVSLSAFDMRAEKVLYEIAETRSVDLSLISQIERQAAS